ncbi:Neurobeachin [Operophtera brumata]|uniref:Neurobeachin n=1 Tax=Operophtera brumata TaxID=104452 RepID=A0A0L7LQI2_OPEBR|nr:Neurobeachin [Operophtera brumata]
MDPLARLMDGAPLPGVLGATRDVRPRGALVHASLAAAPSLGDKKGRHLTGTFCLTGDTMEGIIQCLVFLKAFSSVGSPVGLAQLRKHNVILNNFKLALTLMKLKVLRHVFA